MIRVLRRVYQPIQVNLRRFPKRMGYFDLRELLLVRSELIHGWPKTHLNVFQRFVNGHHTLVALKTTYRYRHAGPVEMSIPENGSDTGPVKSVSRRGGTKADFLHSTEQFCNSESKGGPRIMQTISSWLALTRWFHSHQYANVAIDQDQGSLSTDPR
jgi:hypothetical protein